MKTFVFLLAALLSFQASAGIFSSEARDLDQPCVVYDSDYYWGIGLGKSKPYAANHSATAKYFGSGGVLIGRRFENRDWAIEGSYSKLGSFFNSNLNQTTDLDVFALELIGRYAVDETRYFSFYGKGGYGLTWINVSPVGSTWHGDITYGAGVEITVSPAAERSWYLRLGADRYNTGSFTPVYAGTYMPKDWVMMYSATLLLNY